MQVGISARHSLAHMPARWCGHTNSQNKDRCLALVGSQQVAPEACKGGWNSVLLPAALQKSLCFPSPFPPNLFRLISNTLLRMLMRSDEYMKAPVKKIDTEFEFACTRRHFCTRDDRNTTSRAHASLDHPPFGRRGLCLLPSYHVHTS